MAKKGKFKGYKDCGIVSCAGGCGCQTYGKLGKPVWCMDCGKKAKAGV